MPKTSKPVTLPPGLNPPDGSIAQVAAYRGESVRVVRRKIEAGVYRSYKNGDRRMIEWASVFEDRKNCRELGSQLSSPPKTGKRKPGRPKKAQPTPEPSHHKQKREPAPATAE